MAWNPQCDPSSLLTYHIHVALDRASASVDIGQIQTHTYLFLSHGVSYVTFAPFICFPKPVIA